MKTGVAIVLLALPLVAMADIFRCTGMWEREACFRDQTGQTVCVCVDSRR